MEHKSKQNDMTSSTTHGDWHELKAVEEAFGSGMATVPGGATIWSLAFYRTSVGGQRLWVGAVV